MPTEQWTTGHVGGCAAKRLLSMTLTVIRLRTVAPDLIEAFDRTTDSRRFAASSYRENDAGVLFCLPFHPAKDGTWRL